MNILFLTDNFWPETNAPASRTYEHARAWVAAGASVTVLTCAPNFPQGKIFPGYRNRLHQAETIDGIRVVRVWSYMTANEGFAKRIVDYLSYAVMAFFAGLFERADVIVATSPQFFTTWAGWALSHVRAKPWVFELRDLWPEALADLGTTRNARLIAFLERIELGLYRSAARVVAVSPAFRTNLVSRGIDAAKIDVVTNGVDLSRYTERPRDAELSARFGLTDKFVVGYLGTIGMAHGIDFVLRAAAHVTDPRAHFLFVGDGAQKAAALALATEMGLANVTFPDPVPKDDVPAMLSLFDVALVPLRRLDTYKTVIPSKMFEAASMGKPILLGVEGQAQEIVESYGAGLTFIPEDKPSFLAALARLSGDPALRDSLRAGGRRLAQDYDRERLAALMLAILKSLDRSQSRDRIPPSEGLTRRNDGAAGED